MKWKMMKVIDENSDEGDERLMLTTNKTWGWQQQEPEANTFSSIFRILCDSWGCFFGSFSRHHFVTTTANKIQPFIHVKVFIFGFFTDSSFLDKECKRLKSKDRKQHHSTTKVTEGREMRKTDNFFSRLWNFVEDWHQKEKTMFIV